MRGCSLQSVCARGRSQSSWRERRRLQNCHEVYPQRENIHMSAAIESVKSADASTALCADQGPSFIEFAAPALSTLMSASMHVALQSVPLKLVLTPRSALPQLARALSTACGKEEDPALRVCFLGGSITEQKAGWRPRTSAWLRERLDAQGRRLEEVAAFCGNSGSKVLAFMVDEWVLGATPPQLVLVELAINDGDTLLETADEAAIGAALEGIVRRILSECPCCEICFVFMSVRDDLPLHLRTGSAAWADNGDKSAAEAYLKRIPALHSRIATHYGLPTIDLNPLLCALPVALRDAAFRDDCHHTDEGAALVAAAVCACLCGMSGPSHTENGSVRATRHHNHHLQQHQQQHHHHDFPPPPPRSSLPPPLFARPWSRGSVQRVTPPQLSFFYCRRAPESVEAATALRTKLLQRHTQMDLDPLRPTERAAWWLLYPGDFAEFSFEGSRLGFLTMIGPDAGDVVCEVDNGRWRCRKQLLDRWSYFWRLSVVLLFEGLPAGRHVARVSLHPEKPDPSVLKRPPTNEHWLQCVQRKTDHKLWLIDWLVGE